MNLYMRTKKKMIPQKIISCAVVVKIKILIQQGFLQSHAKSLSTLFQRTY